MGSKKSKQQNPPKPSIRNLGREYKSIVEELHDRETFQELIGGSERACAIVAAAYVDNALISAISDRLFINDTDQFDSIFYKDGGPLSTLHGRAIMALAMNLINENQMGIIKVVKNIRNLYAHSAKSLRFDDDLIAKECSKLPSNQFLTPDNSLSEYRARYINACIKLSFAISTPNQPN